MGVAVADGYLGELIAEVVMSQVTTPGYRSSRRDGLLERRAAALLDQLSQVASTGAGEPVLGAWADLVRSVTGMGSLLGYGSARTERVEEILGRLRAEASGRAGPDRVSVIGAAAQELGSLRARWFLQGLSELARDFRSPPQAQLWEALLRVHLDAGGGAAGSAAFEKAWLGSYQTLSGRRPSPLRGRSLDAVDYRVDGVADGVVVDVVRDPVEIGEVAPQAAFTYRGHPDVAVLAAWERRGDGSTGRRLALLAVVETDHGLLPLAERVDTDGVPGVGRAFGEHLRAWAGMLGQPLLVTSGQAAALAVDVSHSPPVELDLTVPGHGFGPARIWAEVLGGDRELPVRFTSRVHGVFEPGPTVELFHGSKDNRTAITRTGLDTRRTVYLTRDRLAALTVAGRGSRTGGGLISFQVPEALFQTYIAPHEEHYLLPERALEQYWVTQIPIGDPDLIALLNRYMSRPDSAGPVWSRLFPGRPGIGGPGPSPVADRPTTQQPGSGGEAESPAPRTCRGCGRLEPGWANFCEACGRPLSRQPPHTPPADRPASHDTDDTAGPDENRSTR
jgi:hypothetical protein